MNFTEEYAPINGINQYFLHYPSTQQEVVIFLHGGPGSSTASFANNLKKHWDFCSFVYYDQRGTGRTLKRNKTKADDLTIDILLQDLKETISYIKKKYQTNRIILLGQSWGSVLGTQYILKYPDDVICYIGNGQVVDIRREMKVSYDKLKEALESKGAKSDVKKLASLGDYPNVDIKNYTDSVTRFVKLQSKHGQALNISKIMKTAFKSPIFKLSDLYFLAKGSKLNTQLGETLSEYNIQEITKYPVPVYYVLGRDDWQVPSTVAAEYFEKIDAPHKGLFWIENAGHVTDVDNPKDFSKVLKEIVLQLQTFGGTYE